MKLSKMAPIEISKTIKRCEQRLEDYILSETNLVVLEELEQILFNLQFKVKGKSRVHINQDYIIFHISREQKLATRFFSNVSICHRSQIKDWVCLSGADPFVGRYINIFMDHYEK